MQTRACAGRVEACALTILPRGASRPRQLAAGKVSARALLPPPREDGQRTDSKFFVFLLFLFNAPKLFPPKKRRRTSRKHCAPNIIHASGPHFPSYKRLYSPSPLRALVSSDYSNYYLNIIIIQKRRRTSSKHCAPHILHASGPHFHHPVRLYSPSPLRALVSSEYSNKHHHHQIFAKANRRLHGTGTPPTGTILRFASVPLSKMF